MELSNRMSGIIMDCSTYYNECLSQKRALTEFVISQESDPSNKNVLYKKLVNNNFDNIKKLTRGKDIINLNYKIFKLDFNAINLFGAKASDFVSYDDMFKYFDKKGISILKEIHSDKTKIDSVDISPELSTEYRSYQSQIHAGVHLLSNIYANRAIAYNLIHSDILGSKNNTIDIDRLVDTANRYKVLCDQYDKYNKCNIRKSLFNKNFKSNFQEHISSSNFNVNSNYSRYLKPINKDDLYMYTNLKVNGINPNVLSSPKVNIKSYRQNKKEGEYSLRCYQEECIGGKYNNIGHVVGSYESINYLDKNDIFEPVFGGDVYLVSMNFYNSNMASNPSEITEKDVLLNEMAFSENNNIFKAQCIVPTFKTFVYNKYHKKIIDNRNNRGNGSCYVDINNMNNYEIDQMIGCYYGVYSCDELFDYNEYYEKSNKYFDNVNEKQTKSLVSAEKKLLELLK